MLSWDTYLEIIPHILVTDLGYRHLGTDEAL